jgi:uncharacterized cupredoxin-like copper-binding protein
MRIYKLVALGVLPLLAAACGGSGDDDAATPSDDGVVEITMEDNSFDPDEIEVEAGQTVTFEFRNDGDVEHEAFVGTEAEQEAHESEMSPDAEGGHDSGHETESTMAELPDEEHAGDGAVAVAPGESATLEYTFDEAGTVVIGCHEPGHYDAGMKIRVDVA